MSRLLLVLVMFSVYARGNVNADSLYQVYENTTNPIESRLNALHVLSGYHYKYLLPDSAHYFAEIQCELAREAGILQYEIKGRNTCGIIAHIKGDYANALAFFEQGLNLALVYHEKDQPQLVSNALNNIGLVYKDLAEYGSSITYLDYSLRLREAIGDPSELVVGYNNMGLVYEDLGDYLKAISYYEKARDVSVLTENSFELALLEGNIATAYNELDILYEATVHAEKSLDIMTEIGNTNGIAYLSNVLGEIHQKQGEFERSEDYFRKSLEVSEPNSFKKTSVTTYNGLATLFFAMGRIADARKNALKALNLSDEMGLVIETNTAAKILFECYKKENDCPKSLSMVEIYLETKDSLNKAHYKEVLLRKEVEYQFEKQKDLLEIEHDLELKNQHQIQRNENFWRNIIIVGVSVCLVVVCFLMVMWIKRYKLTNRQKLTIQNQKEIVEEKNKAITSSIRYAKRLQDAILPSLTELEEIFASLFLIYLPKDIVSGDFYWVQRDDEMVYFAVADSTGHGVPGAMVSVVCSNALGKAFSENNRQPAEMLDYAANIISSGFIHEDGNVNDGMDISLCAFNPSTLELQWAGAHNPLWVLRKDEARYTLIELQGDKQPVGKYMKAKPFAHHTFQLIKGDVCYLFTDGYADQFGGEKGKKYKIKRWKNFILAIQDSTLPEQKTLLEKELAEWMNGHYQVDDITVMAFRI